MGIADASVDLFAPRLSVGRTCIYGCLDHSVFVFILLTLPAQ